MEIFVKGSSNVRTASVQPMIVKLLVWLTLISTLLACSSSSRADMVVEPLERWWYSTQAYLSLAETISSANNLYEASYRECLEEGRAQLDRPNFPYDYPSYDCRNFEIRGIEPWLTSYIVDGQPGINKFTGTYVRSRSSYWGGPTEETAPLEDVYSLGVHQRFHCPDKFVLQYQKNISRYEKEGPYCILREASPPPPQSCDVGTPLLGNPIDPITFKKQERVVDYASSDGVLKLERFYIDQRQGWRIGSPSRLFDLSSQKPVEHCYAGTLKIDGEIERHCFRYISQTGEQNKVYIYAENGSKQSFTKISGSLFQPGNPHVGKLERRDALSIDGAIWVHTKKNNARDYYSENGQLIATKYSSGRTLYYAYSSETSINGNSLLTAIQDDVGRKIEFTYNDLGDVVTAELPDNQAIQYSYEDEHGNLTQVSWPDGSSIQYLYNEPGLYPDSSAFSLSALTGKIDSLGNRIGTYSYDRYGRAISTEQANGTNKYHVDRYWYDPLGNQISLGTRRTSDGMAILTSQSQPAGSGCSKSTKWLSYTNDLLTKKTEFNGTVTLYGYDAQTGQEDRRVEGLSTRWANVAYLNAGVSLLEGARKISTEWHDLQQEPVKIAEPNLVTHFIYNGDTDLFNEGQVANCAPDNLFVLCRKVLQATLDENGSQGFEAVLDPGLGIRQFLYTYNERGQKLTERRSDSLGPEYSVEYYEDSTESWTKGDRKSVTNALGHTVVFNAYDPNGRLLSMVDENGVEVFFTYDPKGRLTSQSIGGSLTLYEYDLNGNRTRTELPDGTVLNYEYDAAARLIAVENALGDKIDYRYDNANNLVSTTIKDPSGELRYSQEHVYDALSRVQNMIDGEGNISTYLYDAVGNLTGVENANQHLTKHTYDTLSRPEDTLDAMSQVTDYSHDANGNVTQVVDPKGLATRYTYNGFGNLVKQESPDTVATVFDYDGRGNLISKTDARGVITNYRHDALDRLTHIEYPDSPNENVVFSYDETEDGNPGIGRLTSMRDPSGSTGYRYNAQGQVIEKRVNLDGVSLVLTYQYNGAGALSEITYPSGRTVQYGQDSQGRLKQVLTQESAEGTSEMLMDGVIYQPFGPMSEYQHGNGLKTQLGYDRAYRISEIEVGSGDPLISRLYQYDPVSNITQIFDAQNSMDSKNFTYDPLNRLTDALRQDELLSYTYDPVGNRTELYKNGGVELYLYGSGSHRLQARDSSQYHYDSVGNTINNGFYTFQYSASNRLTGVESVGGSFVAEYRYNALGQRVYKRTADDTKTVYLYNETGQLIGEYDETGAVIREYIYRDTAPLALATNNQIYYYHNDHLATPKLLTDANQNIFWQAKHTPFGKAEIQVEQVTNNLRFPGQYFDSETGLHYNYFRDYDPEMGRYLQSDPIGLEGGINTYAYAGGNPIFRTDQFGLAYAPGGEHGVSREQLGLTSSKCLSDEEIDIAAKQFAGMVAGLPGGLPGVVIGGVAGTGLGFFQGENDAQNAISTVVINGALDPDGLGSTITGAAGEAVLLGVLPEGDPTGRESAAGALVGGSLAGARGYGAGAAAPWAYQLFSNLLVNQNQEACSCQR